MRGVTENRTEAYSEYDEGDSRETTKQVAEYGSFKH